MDTQDPVMRVVSEVENRVELLDGRIEKMSRQLPKKSIKIVTLQSLRQMVVNIAKGISGVQYGARPAPVTDIDLAELTSVSVDWIGAFFGTFENEIAARETHLAGSGPVLAAVGAMGHEMLKMSGHERSLERARLLRSLRQVDWSKDAHWVGIAGNFTASGVFSVKGTKEVAYAVYNALTDFENAGYGQIHTRTPDVSTVQSGPASAS